MSRSGNSDIGHGVELCLLGEQAAALVQAPSIRGEWGKRWPIQPGWLLWISPALPGHARGLTAALPHRIIRIGERQGVPVVADRAYTG